MDTMFEPLVLGRLKLKNRFVRSATWLGLAATDGGVTDALVENLATLAAGGVGLIVSGHAYVSPEGQASPRQLGVYDDRLIPGLARLADAVHERGGKIVLQLAHAGIFARTALTGLPALAVSENDSFAPDHWRLMEPADIDKLVADFAAAACRAQAAGCDGVQLHAAHGYLLGQFLSPLFNRRKDQFGGGVEKRTLVCRRIIAAIHRNTGDDFPVLVKLNCSDLSAGGLDREQALQAAVCLRQAGAVAIEVSGGLPRGGGKSPTWTGIDGPEKEAYFRSAAAFFKKRLDIPLVLVGGIRSWEVACRMVENNIADLVAMSRPFICEPDLVARWQAGDRRPARCRSDNLCFRPGLTGKGVHCVTYARRRKN